MVLGYGGGSGFRDGKGSMYLGSRRVRYAHKGGSGRSKEICKSGR